MRDPQATDCSNSLPANGRVWSDWLLKLRKDHSEAQRVGEFGAFAPTLRIGPVHHGKFELGPSSQRRPNLAWGTNELVTADFRSGLVNGHRQSHLACLKSDHKQTKLGNEAEKALSQGAIDTSPDIDQPSGRP
jgi:hypothetical protein